MIEIDRFRLINRHCIDLNRLKYQKLIENDRFYIDLIENRSILIENRYRRFDQIVEIRIDDNSTFESGFQIRFDDVDSIRESESH